jgi:nicotinate-nucleotide pyrophosphorylase (carboxylating)
MSDFDPPRAVVVNVVSAALAEDIGLLGDLTSIATVRDDEPGSAVLAAREEGVLAGTALVDEAFRQVDPAVEVRWNLRDGDPIEPGTVIAAITGPRRGILTGERVALNFLCHCSGIASLTRRYVRAARGNARILDTRKTLPGLRAVQRAAVRAGGGFNHRDSLSAAVLIKDNHLAGLGLTPAVERARSRWPMRIVEVECETIDQVIEARDAGVDIVLVDNMTPDQVAKAVEILDGSAKVEVSGRVTLDSVGAYAETGADFISVGAITHSVRVLDIGLDIHESAP